MNPAHLILAGCVMVAVGAGAGYRYADAQGRATIERMRAEIAVAQQQATAAAVERLTEGNALAERLRARADAAEAARRQTAKERDDAIRKQTVGRPCLDAGLVGVLNGADLRPGGAGGVSVAAGSGAGSAFATDTDVGQWIAGAIDEHEICRERLDAVIDWREAQAAKQGEQP